MFHISPEDRDHEEKNPCLYFPSYFAKCHASFYNEAQLFLLVNKILKKKKKSYFGSHFIKKTATLLQKCTIIIIIQYYTKTHSKAISAALYSFINL